jgi:hypothetical protein
MIGLVNVSLYFRRRYFAEGPPAGIEQAAVAGLKAD